MFSAQLSWPNSLADSIFFGTQLFFGTNIFSRTKIFGTLIFPNPAQPKHIPKLTQPQANPNPTPTATQPNPNHILTINHTLYLISSVALQTQLVLYFFALKMAINTQILQIKGGQAKM